MRFGGGEVGERSGGCGVKGGDLGLEVGDELGVVDNDGERVRRRDEEAVHVRSQRRERVTERRGACARELETV